MNNYYKEKKRREVREVRKATGMKQGGRDLQRKICAYTGGKSLGVGQTATLNKRKKGKGKKKKKLGGAQKNQTPIDNKKSKRLGK